MSLLYGLAAEGVLLFHFLFILFAVFGGFSLLWVPRLIWLHLPVLAWGVWIELSGNICPLTPLENALRIRAGEAGYAGGFIEHYLLPIIYPAGLTRDIQLVLALGLIAINIAAYALVWRSKNASGKP